WSINMDELRGQMMDSAREATWLPSFGLDRELDWLRNMGDWMISKKRYWGLALPIYPCAACDHVTVVGSRAELRESAVAGWPEFEGHSPHRPWVDEVVIACEQCGAAVSRVPDVGNVWLDAGIVAFATLNYHQDREYWAQWFPADLVLEEFAGQFRNWFYALLAMSTTLEGHAPFKTLLAYATVKDAHGQGMHKSKGNAIWFDDAADWLGVEPLRWLFAAAPLERNVNFGRALVDETARRLQPLWEVYRFFVTYANLEGWTPGVGSWGLGVGDEASQPPTPNSHLLDQWLLARLNQLVVISRQQLDAFDARGFTLGIEAFLDDLSNWYVRRSRRRFWGAPQSVVGHQSAASCRQPAALPTADCRLPADQQDAFATLYVTLVTLARLLAPVLPFLAESLYQNLVRELDPTAPASVHLTGYPTELKMQNEELRKAGDDVALLNSQFSILNSTAVVRHVVGLGRVARKSVGLRVRQPLARMLVVVQGAQERAALLRHQGDLLEELNVKAIELLDSSATLLSYRIKPNLRLLGPRLGKQLPTLRAALEQLDLRAAGDVARAVVAGETVTLPFGTSTLTLVPDELLVESAALAGYAVAQEGGVQV
ncbi:MAG: class I tRNA ligase family protein, partial [Roseiflexaceae bacterium]